MRAFPVTGVRHFLRTPRPPKTMLVFVANATYFKDARVAKKMEKAGTLNRGALFLGARQHVFSGFTRPGNTAAGFVHNIVFPYARRVKDGGPGG